MFETIAGGIAVLFIFIGLSTPIILIGLVYYYKKRLEHKQIMAAIEKGTPLSEIMPIKRKEGTWINDISKGIAMLIIAAVTTIIFGAMLFYGSGSLGIGTTIFPFGVFFIIPAVFLGNGIASLIRGRLRRKHETTTEENINGSQTGMTTTTNAA